MPGRVQRTVEKVVSASWLKVSGCGTRKNIKIEDYFWGIKVCTFWSKTASERYTIARQTKHSVSDSVALSCTKSVWTSTWTKPRNLAIPINISRREQSLQIQLPSFKQTLFNVGSFWLLRVASMLSALVLTGYATRVLGLEVLGLWLLASNFSAYFQLFDLGVSSTMPRILPAMRAKGENEKIVELVSTSAGVTILAGLLGLLVTPVIAYYFGDAYNYDSESSRILFWLVLFTLGSVSLSLPFRIGYGLLASSHRFDVSASIELLVLVVKFVAACIALYLTENIFIYGLIMALPPLVNGLIQFRAGYSISNMAAIGGIHPRRWSKDALRTILSMCGASLVITMSSMLLLQGSTLLAGVINATAVAMFSYPMMLVVKSMSLSASFGKFLSPVASDLSGKNDLKGLSRITMESMAVSSALSGFILFYIVLLGPHFLVVWLGESSIAPENMQTMSTILIILTAGRVFLIPGAMSRGMLMGVGKHWNVGSVEMVCSAAGLAAGAFMMLVLKWELEGLAYGISASFILRGLVLYPAMTCSVVGISLPLMIYRGLIRPYAICALALAVALASKYSLNASHEIVGLWVGVLAGTAILVFGTWVFIISHDRKKAITQRIKQILKRVLLRS